MNIGHSSRLPYDPCAYPDKLTEIVGAGNYRLSPDQSYNCNNCLSTLGPRASNNGRGYDVSRVVNTSYAPSQDLVDVDSILSNRNVKESKCKSGKVNPIDVTKYDLMDSNLCNNFLDPESSRLTYPAATYRDMAINRFYNLPLNPQVPIFWNFAENTKLEATDNFDPDIPRVWTDLAQPKSFKHNFTGDPTCNYNNARKCPQSWGKFPPRQ